MEVIQDGENGVLADFFDGRELAEKIASLADDKDWRAQLSATARQTVIDRFDFQTVCWPAYERLIRGALDF
jgi:glycosyltransferase involved in cell wall biosynthesis